MNDAEKKLVDALRTGKYPQISGRLRSDNGYCCLGVACEVLGKGEWVDCAYTDSKEYTERVLTDDVKEELDWDSHNGMLELIDKNNDQSCLSSLNDGGFTFSQIADIIAANLVKKWSR